MTAPGDGRSGAAAMKASRSATSSTSSEDSDSAELRLLCASSPAAGDSAVADGEVPVDAPGVSDAAGVVEGGDLRRELGGTPASPLDADAASTWPATKSAASSSVTRRAAPGPIGSHTKTSPASFPAATRVCELSTANRTNHSDAFGRGSSASTVAAPSSISSSSSASPAASPVSPARSGPMSGSCHASAAASRSSTSLAPVWAPAPDARASLASERRRRSRADTSGHQSKRRESVLLDTSRFPRNAHEST
mmetsp:Transcript_9874/g.38428  ORF Transcript_9874/g.38428 Transcript_9874/m.38428 type:complete len:251 (-) Transcript_9874:45-797(-)